MSITGYVACWLIINRFKKITANNEYAMIINHQGVIFNSYIDTRHNKELILWKNIDKIIFFEHELEKISGISICLIDSMYPIELWFTFGEAKVLSMDAPDISRAIEYYSDNKFSF